VQDGVVSGLCVEDYPDYFIVLDIERLGLANDKQEGVSVWRHMVLGCAVDGNRRSARGLVAGANWGRFGVPTCGCWVKDVIEYEPAQLCVYIR
jgi:hypothetical protein